MLSVKRGRSARSGRNRLAKKNEITARRSGGPRNYDLYRHNLSLYQEPPLDEVSLEEFELFAVDRLRALKCIETAKIRFPKRDGDFDKSMRNAAKNVPLTGAGDRDTLYDERRKDHISHFILRLAYCRTEELRRWFLQYECELFRYRFDNEPIEVMLRFLQQNNMEYTPIDKDLKNSIKKMLATCTYTSGGNLLNEEAVMKTDYFAVPFEEATELVRGRRVYLEKGVAYVPKTQILSIIVGAFRTQLSAALTATSRALPTLEEDSRLLPMLSNLSKQYLGNDYSNGSTKKHEVSAASIPQLARESFPMCMRISHSHLEEHHHLKHGARMQYGLFLKGIGLSLEQALLFWRTEFSKSMGADKFEKNHAYNVRHNYGKEGKRTDYSPYSCMKIIMSNPPSSGDAHGCPFRHYDRDQLTLQMRKYNVPAKSIGEINQLVQKKHFQIACTKYFEATHNVENIDFALQHPNQYFEKSREVRGEGEIKEEGGKTTTATGAAITKESTEVKNMDADADDDLDDDALLESMDVSEGL